MAGMHSCHTHVCPLSHTPAFSASPMVFETADLVLRRMGGRKCTACSHKMRYKTLLKGKTAFQIVWLFQERIPAIPQIMALTGFKSRNTFYKYVVNGGQLTSHHNSLRRARIKREELDFVHFLSGSIELFLREYARKNLGVFFRKKFFNSTMLQ